MSTIGQSERATQTRVIALFRDELGYRFLGDWSDREGNSNIEETLLAAWLKKSSYTPAQISAALYKLRTEADNHNGSARNIAGIFNEGRTVLGLMPHPEDATDPLLGGTDGQGLFAGLAGANKPCPSVPPKSIPPLVGKALAKA